jgi:hypothetical protein
MDERTRLHGLVVRAGVWVWAIERLSNAAAENRMYDAHMCALALDHLRRCVDSIKNRDPALTPEEKKLLKIFNGACEKANIKDLRDALEHEEDRFSGDRPGKRRQSIVYQGEDAGAPAIAWDSRTNRLRWIYVLGVRYEIGEAAEAAIALRDILLELAERTGPWKTVPTQCRAKGGV